MAEIFHIDKILGYLHHLRHKEEIENHIKEILSKKTLICSSCGFEFKTLTDIYNRLPIMDMRLSFAICNKEDCRLQAMELSLKNRGIKNTEVVLECYAHAEDGKKFEKVVMLKNTDKRPVLSFGGFCEYYLEDIQKSYPFDHNLYIDAMGRNHLGSPVYIKQEDINKILEKIKEMNI